MRIFLLLFAALILAGGTGYYALRGLRGPTEPTNVAEAVAAPKPTEVFVAASELTVGTIILPEQLGRLPIAKSAITPEMVTADETGEALLVGSVARQVLPMGVPIARSATVQPGDRGFLAAVLPRGKRAISIPIGEVAGISGLVLPGDRVDIILTYSVTGAAIDSGRDIRASETVVTNLRILALDQRLQKNTADAAGSKDSPPIARTATLEVTPQQAEMITLATTLGDLSLVLNSVRDGGDPKPAEAGEGRAGSLTQVAARVRDSGGRLVAVRPRNLTLDSDVTSLLQRQNPGSLDATSRIQVVRGNVSRDVEFGAEVAAAGADAPGVAPASELK